MGGLWGMGQFTRDGISASLGDNQVAAGSGMQASGSSTGAMPSIYSNSDFPGFLFGTGAATLEGSVFSEF